MVQYLLSCQVLSPMGHVLWQFADSCSFVFIFPCILNPLLLVNYPKKLRPFEAVQYVLLPSFYVQWDINFLAFFTTTVFVVICGLSLVNFLIISRVCVIFVLCEGFQQISFVNIQWNTLFFGNLKYVIVICGWTLVNLQLISRVLFIFVHCEGSQHINVIKFLENTLIFENIVKFVVICGWFSFTFLYSAACC